MLVKVGKQPKKFKESFDKHASKVIGDDLNWHRYLCKTLRRHVTESNKASNQKRYSRNKRRRSSSRDSLNSFNHLEFIPRYYDACKLEKLVGYIREKKWKSERAPAKEGILQVRKHLGPLVTLCTLPHLSIDRWVVFSDQFLLWSLVISVSQRNPSHLSFDSE